ncbi:MAG TPA: hypothetical protein VHI13_03515 [Candidatus Kapabacteria bacterium]|nr:hypothetical protein [Candidatus Kapabacteria bacterium]
MVAVRCVRLVAFVTILLFFSGTLVRAQDRLQSGVINLYTPVLAFGDCASIVVRDVQGYAAGDLVMIIQMQGAVIDTSGTSAYGSVADYNNAGNYEWNRIGFITGDTIHLTHYLSNTYSLQGHVQLVRIPEYGDVVIPSSAVVACAPWNGETGGVLALRATGSVRIDGSMNVTGMGFRGGTVKAAGFVPYYDTTFAGPENPDRYGLKGEGIAGFGVPPNIAGHGAAANAGGGGGNHNAGGGGGSNSGAGGLGGYAYRDGRYAGDYRHAQGLGGYAIVPNRRLFLGGGGGAGHDNNNVGTSGARGGGIIAIEAAAITGTNGRIVAAGADAADAAYDGGGGGGAGGSVVMSVAAFNGTSTVDVHGGAGADAGTTVFNQDAGPGGGGGGGAVSLTTALPPASALAVVAAGGANGTDVFAHGPYGATPGAAGFVAGNQELVHSTREAVRPIVDAGPNVDLCLGSSVTLNATGGVHYHWTPIAGLSCVDCASPVASPNTPTTYYVVATDSNGCSNLDSVRVNVNTCADADFILPTICSGHSEHTFVDYYNRRRVDTIVSVQFLGDRASDYAFEGTLPFVLTPTVTMHIPVLHRWIVPGAHVTLMRMTAASGDVYDSRVLAVTETTIESVLKIGALHLGVHAGPFDTCFAIPNPYYVRVLITDTAWVQGNQQLRISTPGLPINIDRHDSILFCLHLESLKASDTATLVLGGVVVDSCNIGRCISQLITVDGGPPRPGTPDAAVGGDESNAGLAAEIFPNPSGSDGAIRIRLPHTDRVRITVLDLAGREVAVAAEEWLPGGEHVVPFSVPGLPSGTYSFVIRTRTGVASVRHLIVR